MAHAKYLTYSRKMENKKKTDAEKRYEDATARYDEWKRDHPGVSPHDDSTGRALAEERDKADTEMVEAWNNN